jgi:glycosyltransferase involved in cell wall biosynthesis
MIITGDRRRVRLAIVSPYPPHRSPIAAYTHELCRALRAVAPQLALSVWMIGHQQRRDRRVELAGTITPGDASAYHRAAQQLHARGTDVVLIQSGPGAAGGPHGRHLLGLCAELVRLGVPYLVTLHDVRVHPRPDEANMLTALCRDAARVIVLSHTARQALVNSRIVAPDRIQTLPLAAPSELIATDVSPPAPLAELVVDLCGRTVLSTIGLLRPGKGIEVAIAALPRIARERPDVCYVVAAPTHSDHARADGERYREALHRQAAHLGVTDHLRLIDTELSRADLVALLRCTAVYLAPDLDTGRTQSASLAYAVAAGRPVVATAHPYAREVVPGSTSVLVPPADPGAIATGVTALLADPERCRAARRAAQGPHRLPTVRHTAQRAVDLLQAVAATPTGVACG